MLRCSSKYHLPLQTVDELYEICAKKERITGVFLEKITDPHNLGAIIRSCHYLGVDFIVVDHYNRCPLSSTVSRTSAGALELLDVYSAIDSVALLEEAKSRHWSIIAASTPKSTSRQSASDSSIQGQTLSAQKFDNHANKQVKTPSIEKLNNMFRIGGQRSICRNPSFGHGIHID